jgi:ring-1,2-phenylacetyl-CoA epoxidase subunit PaaB
VQASSAAEAMAMAGRQLQSKMVYNVWVIPAKRIRFTQPEERDLWTTLPEKKFRDATDYRGGDKLKEFLDRANPLL